MSAAATLSDLPSRPGRQNDRSADHVTDPYRAFHIATLLRQVINYAKGLIVTVRQRATSPDFARFAEPFGTCDVRLILDRIARAISRAAILEDDMLKVARLGRHLYTDPAHRPTARGRPANRAPAKHQPNPPPGATRNLAIHRSTSFPAWRRSSAKSAAIRSGWSSPASAATSASRRTTDCGRH